MASPDVFLSSPPRGARRQPGFVISSSPELPPLREILSQIPRKPALRSGSRAAPIPDGAPTAFTSAARVWKAAQAEAAATVSALETTSLDLIVDEDTSVSVVEVPPKAAPKARKPRRRKPTKKSTDLVNGAGSPDGGQPWKKYRPTSEENGSVLMDGGPEVGLQDVESQCCDKTKDDGNSLPLDNGAELPKPVKVKENDYAQPLQLERAMPRRLDWTPPPVKTYVVLDSDPTGVTEPSSSIGPDEELVFGNLLEAYGCNEISPQEPDAPIEQQPKTLKKRKLLEPFTTNSTTATAMPEGRKSPIKQKAPKKKPLTITGLATAAYKVASQPEEQPPEAGLLHHLVEDGNKGDTPQLDVESRRTSKPRPRKATTKTSKKKQPPRPTLLSPGAALKQVANQDFVFGTSSQLVVEQSSSFLRDLQNAMVDSNRNDDPFRTPLNSDGIEPVEQRGKLWTAAARDMDGDLFDVEIVDLVNGPLNVPAPAKENNPFGYFKDESDVRGLELGSRTPSPPKEPSFDDEPDILRDPPRDLGDDENPLTLNNETCQPDASQVSNTNAQIPPSTRNAEAAADLGSAATSRIEEPARPHYELYTDAQLSREIASYGFKPVKRRNAMVALLGQCWESQNGTGRAGLGTAATLSSAASQRNLSTTTVDLAKAPVKKRRGRPRKNSVGSKEIPEPPPSAQSASPPKQPRKLPKKDVDSTPKKARAKTSNNTTATAKPTSPPPQRRQKGAETVIEISDSASDVDCDPFSSSPGSSPSQTFSPPPVVDLSVSMDEDTELTLTLSPDDEQTAVHEHITKAVTTAPRTTDPDNPSWHEKMLLYDPIVLEDLAAWLNSGQLTRVGYDGEVAPGEVKKWCESKSICCLWKVNLRGKERKRY